MLIPVLVLTAAVSAPQSPQAPSVDRLGDGYYLFLQGLALADENELDAALARYREALDRLGESAEVYAEIAAVQARRGDLDEARADAERALTIDNNSRTAHRILGLIQASALERQPDDDAGPMLSEAIGHLERALANNFRDLPAQFALAELYIRARRYDDAIKSLTDFLADRPGYPQAQLLLIQAYQAVGRTDDARALIEELRGASGAGGAERSATQYEAQGDWAGAAEAWGALVRAEPQNQAYRIHQATALANDGQLAAAREAVDAFIERWPDEVAGWYLRTEVEQRAGRYDEAEQAARRITEIDPDDPRGPLSLAEVRTSRGDFSGVVDVLAPRVSAASDEDVQSGVYARMASLLSNAYVRMGSGKNAVRALETARRRAPDDLQVLFTLAATYERTREFDQAERAFRDLVAADPEHAPGLNYLGYMLAERGRKLDEAVELIRRALAIDADNPSYLDSLGWAYYKQAKYADAVGPLERAAGAMPDTSIVQQHLGEVYFKLGRFSDAAAAFTRALAGDREDIDSAAVEKKRDSALALSPNERR